VTFKVAPLPDDTATLLYPGLPDELAVELMCLAMGSPYEVSGTVHLSALHGARLKSLDGSLARSGLTAIRIENFMKSVLYRKGRLTELLAAFGPPHVLDMQPSLAFWSEMRRMGAFAANDTMLWRISTSPRHAAKLVAGLKRHMDVHASYDWSGGLIWLDVPPSADAGAADVHRAVAVHGGHAMLIRAGDQVRRSVDVFQPQSPGVERLSRQIKAAFDPMGLLNPGRMYAAF
jgi:glycolate oxidase FAD binding subunit